MLHSIFAQLLDDGTGRDPLQVHNFGKAASYLFRPCTNEDGSPDEVCLQNFSYHIFHFSLYSLTRC